MNPDIVIEESWSSIGPYAVCVLKPSKSSTANAHHFLTIYTPSWETNIFIVGRNAYRGFVQCMKAACSWSNSAGSTSKYRGVTVKLQDQGPVFITDEVVVVLERIYSSSAKPAYVFQVMLSNWGTSAMEPSLGVEPLGFRMTTDEMESFRLVFGKTARSSVRALMSSDTEEWFLPPFLQLHLTESCLDTGEAFLSAFAHINEFCPAYSAPWSTYLRRFAEVVYDEDDELISPDIEVKLTEFRPWLFSPPMRKWVNYDCDVDSLLQFGKGFAKTWLERHPAGTENELLSALVATHRWLPSCLAKQVAGEVVARAFASIPSRPSEPPAQ